MDNTNENSNIHEESNKNNLPIGKANILVVGKTGTGKSTLINAICKENVRETGLGRPVTKNIKKNEMKDISLYDSVGITLQNCKEILAEIEDLITKQNKHEDTNKHIHIAWICISEGSSRIEDIEIEMVNFIISKNIPAIIVLTKASSDEGLQKEIKEVICPNVNEVIRVRALEKKFEDGHIMKPYNLDNLLKVTCQFLSVNSKFALINSQGISKELNMEFEANKILEDNINKLISKNTAINKDETEKELIYNISLPFGLELNEYSLNKICDTLYHNDNLLSTIFNEEKNSNDNLNLIKDIYLNKSKEYIDVLSKLHKNNKLNDQNVINTINPEFNIEKKSSSEVIDSEIKSENNIMENHSLKNDEENELYEECIKIYEKKEKKSKNNVKQIYDSGKNILKNFFQKKN